MTKKIDYEELYRDAHVTAMQMVHEGRMDEAAFKEMFPTAKGSARNDREYIECHLGIMRQKRPALVLKGLRKHAFDNEWNTMQQILYFWTPIQKWLAKEYAMQWASWGAANLADVAAEQYKEA